MLQVIVPILSSQKSISLAHATAPKWKLWITNMENLHSSLIRKDAFFSNRPLLKNGVIPMGPGEEEEEYLNNENEDPEGQEEEEEEQDEVCEKDETLNVFARYEEFDEKFRHIIQIARVNRILTYIRGDDPDVDAFRNALEYEDLDQHTRDAIQSYVHIEENGCCNLNDMEKLSELTNIEQFQLCAEDMLHKWFSMVLLPKYIHHLSPYPQYHQLSLLPLPPLQQTHDDDGRNGHGGNRGDYGSIDNQRHIDRLQRLRNQMLRGLNEQDRQELESAQGSQHTLTQSSSTTSDEMIMPDQNETVRMCSDSDSDNVTDENHLQQVSNQTNGTTTSTSTKTSDGIAKKQQKKRKIFGYDSDTNSDEDEQLSVNRPRLTQAANGNNNLIRSSGDNGAVRGPNIRQVVRTSADTQAISRRDEQEKFRDRRRDLTRKHGNSDRARTSTDSHSVRSTSVGQEVRTSADSLMIRRANVPPSRQQHNKGDITKMKGRVLQFDSSSSSDEGDSDEESRNLLATPTPNKLQEVVRNQDDGNIDVSSYGTAIDQEEAMDESEMNSSDRVTNNNKNGSNYDSEIDEEKEIQRSELRGERLHFDSPSDSVLGKDTCESEPTTIRRKRRRYSEEEKAAIMQGVQKYGEGKWAIIKDDPQFSAILSSRTSVNIKDCYRTIIRQKGKEKMMQGLKQPLETTTSTAAASTERSRRRTPPSRQTSTSPSASVSTDRRGTPVDNHPSPSIENSAPITEASDVTTTPNVRRASPSDRASTATSSRRSKRKRVYQDSA